ncbi:MAG: PhzF family phenazine biosynthesis protein, partial [Spirochaeta sp.]
MKYWIVDVFCKEKYSGNQLAVVLADDALTTAEMQRIAQEFHFSETSFIFAGSGQSSAADAAATPVAQATAAGSGQIPRFKVRIFTPESEVPFAGHPTLGTAYVIRTQLTQGLPQRIEMDLPAGIIPVDFDDTAGLQWMQQLEPVFGTVHDRAQAAGLIGLET